MIYSHKPQRSGRSITSNTNNPPQDPPAPHITVEQNNIVSEIPDILINDTTPPVPEVCTHEKLTLTKPEITSKVVEKIVERKVVPKKILPKVVEKITPKKITSQKITSKTPQKQVQKISLVRRIISRIYKIFGGK